MTITFFSTTGEGPGERLLHKIETHLPGLPIQVARTVKTLSDRFHQPVLEPSTLILMPENKEQLQELIAMGNLLNDIPILLVLPDRKPATIDAGHRLFPRFITYMDSDFSYFFAVLNKMLEKNKLQKER